MRLPLLILHISAGVLAMFAGAASISFRKGSRWHGTSGNVFVTAMLSMATAASFLAYMKHQTGNFYGGLLAIYMVATAWATARRRDRETGILDWIGCFFALTIGILSVIHGFQKIAGQLPPDGAPSFMDFFMGSVIFLAGVGDVRMMLRGISGKRRIARHPLAHVFWMVYRHRFFLPWAATSISRMVARIPTAPGAGPAAAGAAHLLDDSRALHWRLQENVDAACRRGFFTRNLVFNRFQSHRAPSHFTG
jgi:uncharacterized membrane protein